MKTYDLKKIIDINDKQTIYCAYEKCKKTIPKTILDIFVKMIRSKSIELNELNKISTYSYNDKEYENELFILANKVFYYVAENYGQYWEVKDKNGYFLDDFEYLCGYYVALGYHDINLNRTDGKKQVTSIINGKDNKVSQKRNMTVKRALSILEYYYKKTEIDKIVKEKGKSFFQVYFNNGNIVRMSKEELENMEKVNG